MDEFEKWNELLQQFSRFRYRTTAAREDSVRISDVLLFLKKISFCEFFPLRYPMHHPRRSPELVWMWRWSGYTRRWVCSGMCCYCSRTFWILFWSCIQRIFNDWDQIFESECSSEISVAENFYRSHRAFHSPLASCAIAENLARINWFDVFPNSTSPHTFASKLFENCMPLYPEHRIEVELLSLWRNGNSGFRGLVDVSHNPNPLGSEKTVRWSTK